MTIFCVGGVSGSGKTTLINQHHSLQPLQLYDVSDYYAAAEDYGRHIGWQQAFELLLEDVHNYLQRNPNGDVVLEAFFRPDGKQREMVLDLADNFNQRVLFLWCHASRQQCYQRVYEQHAWNDTEQRREARLRFINEAIGRWFCGVAGEDRDAVLHNYENGLY